jgi:hypothetical protein
MEIDFNLLMKLIKIKFTIEVEVEFIKVLIFAIRYKNASGTCNMF